jgi:hypothetical protein
MNRITLVMLTLPALCGCAGFIGGSLAADRESNWYETGQVLNRSRDEIARTVKELLLRQGYLTAEFDVALERASTCWDTQYSTRWREGVRTMMEAEILPHHLGGFNVRVRSIMEVNDNENMPSVPERARWVGAGVSEKHKTHIPNQAIKLHTLLKHRFFGMNP